MKHSWIQSVNYGAINYYLQNINEICSLIAKQVNPGATVFFFSFPLLHDQVRGERSSQSFMQQATSSGGVAEGAFKMKMHVSAKQEEPKEQEGRGGRVESWFELLHLLF